VLDVLYLFSQLTLGDPQYPFPSDRTLVRMAGRTIQQWKQPLRYDVINHLAESSERGNELCFEACGREGAAGPWCRPVRQSDLRNFWRHTIRACAELYSRSCISQAVAVRWDIKYAENWGLGFRSVVLNLGSIEPLGFDGAVLGVRGKPSETWPKAWLYHSKKTMVTVVVTHFYILLHWTNWGSTKAWKTT